MTKLQAMLAAIAVLVAGVALIVVGYVTKNNAILGIGIGLVPAAAAALGIPRPQDAIQGTTDKVV